VTGYERVDTVPAAALAAMECAHPLKGVAGGYEFRVPLLEGDHVTDDTVPALSIPRPVTAARLRCLDGRMRVNWKARGINTTIPYTVDENGALTDQGARLHRQARHQRQGRKGRRQTSRDQR